MERQYDASCLEEHLNKRTNFDGTLIANQLKEYQRYRDTGLTPEEITDHEEILKAYRHVCGGKSPEEITRLHKLIKQQGKELNRRDELIRKLDEERDYWKNETQEMANIADKNINEKLKVQEERDFWEREAKRYCAALGEQKIKLQRLKCEMCKDIGKCVEC